MLHALDVQKSVLSEKNDEEKPSCKKRLRRLIIGLTSHNKRGLRLHKALVDPSDSIDDPKSN